MEPRGGDWIQTYTGRQFWPCDPRVDDVDVLDIAHALSNQCRFGGHSRMFYSVAEHCVRVSYVCDLGDALVGLLHDAAEAYIIDVPRPLKRNLLGYKEIEAAIWVVIAEKFGVMRAIPASVSRADEILLATEARDLMTRPPNAWAPMPNPLPQRIEPWTSALAKTEFLARFRELNSDC